MRRRQYRSVIAIGSLALLTLVTDAVARPYQDRRPHAQAQQTRTGIFDMAAPAPHQRLMRQANTRQAPAQRRLRLHELLQRQFNDQPQARPVRATRAVRRPSAPARIQLRRRIPVARANYARAVEPDTSSSVKGRSRASALVAEARRHLGTNPTKRARLWCARFLNLVLKRVGLPGTGSDAAKSFAFYGRRISQPRYGAIAVLVRKGGGHVGIVTGVDRRGNPILIAGNNGRRKVGVSVYPKRRVIAYVIPHDSVPGKRKILQASR